MRELIQGSRNFHDLQEFVICNPEVKNWINPKVYILTGKLPGSKVELKSTSK